METTQPPSRLPSLWMCSGSKMDANDYVPLPWGRSVTVPPHKLSSVALTREEETESDEALALTVDPTK